MRGLHYQARLLYTATTGATAATSASAEVAATAATAVAVTDVAATQAVLPVRVFGSPVRSLWKLPSGDEGNLRLMVARTCQGRGNKRTTITSAVNVPTETMIMHSRKMHSVLARSNTNGINKDYITGQCTLEALTDRSVQCITGRN